MKASPFMEDHLPKPDLSLTIPSSSQRAKGNRLDGVPYGKARFPEYRTRATRLESFKTWPRSQEFNPDRLADAGFFYEGVGDKIQCFVCGSIFHNLDELFSPKEEHTELLPHCQFARLYKENPKALVEVVDIPAVKAVVQLGFPLPQVEKSYRQLRQAGNQSPEAGDLLDLIWTTPQSSNLTNGFHNSLDEGASQQTLSESEEDLYSAGPSGSRSSPPQACARYDGEDVEDKDEEEAIGEEPIVEIDIKKLHQDQAEGARLRRKLDELEHVGICRGCNSKKADTVNLPCGHIATCQECVYKFNRCRICNTLIQGIVKVYMV